MEKLSKLMGHSSVTTTERYAHLRTDLFRVEDYDRLSVDLRAKDADVVALNLARSDESGTHSNASVTRGARTDTGLS